MAGALDFSGLGGMSLKQSSLTMLWVIFVVGGALFGTSVGLLSLNRHYMLDILIENMFIPWFSIANWAMWFICFVWGYIAIILPCRPRFNKIQALNMFLILLVLHTASHMMWMILFLKRAHNFFGGSLAGNIAKETVESLSEKFAQKEWVQNVLFVAVPVLNFLTAPMMYELYRDHFPPLHLAFLVGWNWAASAFVLGAIPVVINCITLVVVLGYKSAVIEGGDGTETVAPSKLAFFYSLPYRDRRDIRDGATLLDDYENDYNTTEESGYASSIQSGEGEEASGGSKTPSSRGGGHHKVKRIPSYKPNRKIIV
jgi:hypothetical protein